ncbi:Phosphoglucomutase-2 [Globomyces sp. JEL0801]|nr:Phosphoglucomutase-2 [Globomyces sp. JEL0801]
MNLFDIAKEYLKLDQNPITNAHIKLLVDEKDTVSLNKLLSSRLTFGTAGLRAEMGSGYSRMNELTVIQASQGLCAYSLEIIPDFKSRGVVIGHDHRHNSDSFARLTAAVFLAKGVKVYYYPDLVHTPLVPYGVTHFNAGCGIMITASHNPKQDNGYKVYAGNGCQIISPHDKEIADRIMYFRKNLIPWTWDYKLVETSSLVTNPTSIIDKYFEKLASMSHFGLQNNTQNVKFCYTAMHGVGLSFAQRSFKAFNLIDFYPTPEQMYPDPEFPTVKFPNPEEGEGALALAMENASRNDCAIILANDPDADRLAIAEFQKS